ncbi:NosL family protein [Citrifermentans bemidjiense Bem]|uniref:NosL family protein n=1 Tax=Citrifermentans bemidjiense (strain ATCC BAA-1014 / DSM 16622 / JCM 12645 / Bem) TaxID=404380 RepID=B5ECW0_CITBB|nr:nitrous oxide reductase accessory protein NosL [Citrifermentans bemidjiense]ACH40577.1 NosL family protein [Citrifermentans bemidjiense Bem]
MRVVREVIITCLVIAAITGFALAAPPDLDKYRTCNYCGMDRSKYGHSRMLIEYDDGTSVAACSLHCAAVDLAVNIDRTASHIYVGDYGSRKLIDAETASWVIGGSRPGVMSANAKWAFETKEGAAGFIKEHGGTLSTFDDSVSAAYLDMYKDTKAIRERHKAKHRGSSGGPR